MTPTAEQLTCIEAARETRDNLLITALAGAAKTTTLVLIAEALPATPILCLAFNKSIALEMAERLPSNCKSSTLNALGHGIWSGMVGKRLQLSAKKAYFLTREALGNLPKAQATELWKGFKEILVTVKLAKSSGYVPPAACKAFAQSKPLSLISEEDFFANCEYRLSSAEQRLVNTILTTSISEAFEGRIDFDDQIYMPTCFRAIFPLHPLVLVDEAQDLSVLNHAFLRKLARKRLIAVGDPCQAIYGFRGAHGDSMGILATAFSMTRLSLTTSFRCPEAIVDHVQERAPDMRAWTRNPTLGHVTTLPEWSFDDLPTSSVVICRNNAPLYRMAIALLQAGRAPKLANGGLGKTLLILLHKLGPPNMERETAIGEVMRWEQARLSRSRDSRGVQDQAECLRVFLNATESLGQALAFATSLFNHEGAVQLMTGHKAKGLEFPRVFFLDEYLVSEEGQDPNLRYVICTRTKDELIYINTKQCKNMGGKLN